MLNIKKNAMHFSQFTTRSLAFTLAEVLITLAIIGVVAALTIPTLMQKNQDQNTVVKLKKVYSVLSNAYNLAVQENGTPDTWGLTSATPYDSAIGLKMLNAITPYLSVAQDCGNTSTKGCFPDITYKYLSGSTWTDWVNINQNTTQFARARLADGISLATQYGNANTNCNGPYGTTAALQSACGMLYVDVNGNKSSGKLGTDLFMFYFTQYGIIPSGTASDTSYSFSSRCIGDRRWGCAAWVIYNGNLDYNRCSGLDWGGQTTCP